MYGKKSIAGNRGPKASRSETGLKQYKFEHGRTIEGTGTAAITLFVRGGEEGRKVHEQKGVDAGKRPKRFGKGNSLEEATKE